MKIHLPAYEPLLKGNEHLRHGEIEIDLGEDVVKIVRCKNCKHRGIKPHCDGRHPDFYCAHGEERTARNIGRG